MSCMKNVAGRMETRWMTGCKRRKKCWVPEKPKQSRPRPNQFPCSSQRPAPARAFLLQLVPYDSAKRERYLDCAFERGTPQPGALRFGASGSEQYEWSLV